MSTESAKSSDSQRPIVDAQPSDPLREVLLCGAVFATSLCVYLLTLAPTVALGDSPELAVAAHRLGIAHPTGYPLYTLLGHLWLNLLPVGDVAWRMNLFSALAGAAGMAVFASFLLRFTQSALGAWAGAISFAFTPLFWAQCTLTEVYSLHVFLLAVVMWMWGQWEETRERRWLNGLALSIGFAATHHGMTILLVPFLVFVLLTRAREWWGAAIGRPAHIAGPPAPYPLSLPPHRGRRRSRPRLWGDPRLEFILGACHRLALSRTGPPAGDRRTDPPQHARALATRHVRDLLGLSGRRAGGDRLSARTAASTRRHRARVRTRGYLRDVVLGGGSRNLLHPLDLYLLDLDRRGRRGREQAQCSLLADIRYRVRRCRRISTRIAAPQLRCTRPERLLRCPRRDDGSLRGRFRGRHLAHGPRLHGG
ncbi:MAG: DUF2723 domain-containing protein [Myxococcales bacterium]|nr:DUF2723 domain-containing protein [Myxococcales bacterium]